MPIPAIAAIALQQLGQQKQNAFNIGSTLFFNNQERKWNEKMYNWQRRDAIADFNMVNEYNSPANQMARYKEAGLNPHLIYGQQSQAAPLRSSSVEGYNPQRPDVSFDALSSGIAQYTDLSFKQAQTDNVRQATLVAAQEAALKAVQIDNVVADTARKRVDTSRAGFDLGQAQKLAGVSLDMATAELNKIRTETRISLDRNEREAAMNSKSLQEAVERIALLRAQQGKNQDERNEIKQRIENMKKDGTIKDMEIDLRKKGVQPNDWIWWRKVQEILDQLMKESPNPQGNMNWDLK